MFMLRDFDDWPSHGLLLGAAHRTRRLSATVCLHSREEATAIAAGAMFEISNVYFNMTTNQNLPPQAFENTSTNVAASQMRNALNNLIDTVPDPSEKKVSFTPWCWARKKTDRLAAFRS